MRSRMDREVCDRKDRRVSRMDRGDLQDRLEYSVSWFYRCVWYFGLGDIDPLLVDSRPLIRS